MGFPGGFLSMGGTSSTTDRGRALGGWNGEWNLFNSGLPMSMDQINSGNADANKGAGNVAYSADWWKGILGGDKNRFMELTAPATNAVAEQFDAQRAAQAELGTSRGGGVNATNQQAATERDKTINTARFSAQPVAAQELAKTGGQQAQIAIEQVSNGLRLLGLSESAIQHIIDSSMQSRKDSYAINQDTQNQIKQVVLNLLGVASGGQ